ncbi:class I SAM-dependent methyltransferase [Maricaulis sp.]|uniref:class I SAM-dependent methyltransferase n=1 Tax=Maricaulis sp. TaxID=1486257 RepID=UPI001B0D0E85|nr:class I SAM-dependent methyltransferase [Maricaulis sp.]MBO6766225.1 class I SAM-dependent methyltransferase [Maricaulis sp.]
MLTVRLKALDLDAGQRVLDLGCGQGRHLHGLYWDETPVTAVGVDLCHDDVVIALDKFFELPPPEPASPLRHAVLATANGEALPFPDRSFDRIICSEVLEHVPDPDRFLSEISRLLKPGGIFVASVPRYWPEAICWWLAPGYPRTPGGHVRIFRPDALKAQVEKHGFRRYLRHWAHSLHSPYWWLQCALWDSRETSTLVRIYRKFLEWDLLDRPWLTRAMEAVLDPVMGKSVVMYFRKTA